MFDFLSQTLSDEPLLATTGQTAQLDWIWRAQGIIELSPHHLCDSAVVISAGIHGNETAPIELLNQLVSELLSGVRLLKVRLLVLLGNPSSMRVNKRFVDADMNSMFGGRHARYCPNGETGRAHELEQAMVLFYRTSFAAGATRRFYYDLHTAIRGSLHVRFGLLPLQTRPHGAEMLSWLEAAGLDALVFHRSPGGTFTYFSSEVFHADSCTLELGKALPFGSNDHQQFVGIRHALEALVSDAPLLDRQAEAPLKRYRVTQDIIRSQEAFQLHIPADALNFTAYPKGFVITEEVGKAYRVEAAEGICPFPECVGSVGVKSGADVGALLKALETFKLNFSNSNSRSWASAHTLNLNLKVGLGDSLRFTGLADAHDHYLRRLAATTSWVRCRASRAAGSRWVTPINRQSMINS